MSISLKNVSYAYAAGSGFEKLALRGLSLELEKGKITAIMGRSGCGKSTAIRVMAGMLTPDDGQVLLDGENINTRKFDLRLLRKRLAVVLQQPDKQFTEKTVYGQLSRAVRRRKQKNTKTEDAIKSAAEMAGLEAEDLKKAPNCLSDSQKQLLAVECALASGPDILLLDDVLSELDGVQRKALLERLAALKNDGTAIAIATNDADSAAQYADKVYLLRDGELYREGTPEKVFAGYMSLKGLGFSLPQCREAAQLLGLPKDTIGFEELADRLKARYGDAKK